MISHENMMYSAEVTIKSLALGADDLPLLAFPLFHVNSLFYGVLTAIVLQVSPTSIYIVLYLVKFKLTFANGLNHLLENYLYWRGI